MKKDPIFLKNQAFKIAYKGSFLSFPNNIHWFFLCRDRSNSALKGSEVADGQFPDLHCTFSEQKRRRC